MLTVPVVDPNEIWGQSLRARLPGADFDAVLIEMQNTIREFCKQSMCLVYDIPLVMVDGQAEYSLPVPVITQPDPLDADWAGLQPLYVHSAVFGETETRRYPRDYPPVRGAASQTGSPMVFWLPEPRVVELVPTPNDAVDGDEFVVTTSLIPILPMQSVPKHLSDYYFDEVLDGTSGRMMAHAKRPYSDPRLAQYYTQRFRSGMRVAKDEVIRRWGNAERSFRFNPDWSRKVPQRVSR